MTQQDANTTGPELIREEGAQLMLDALIAIGVIRLDIPNQAVRPGSAVGMELLDRELAARGLRRR